eukprot:ANDGO_03523.mRNA.1 Sulfate transporter 4.1
MSVERLIDLDQTIMRRSRPFLKDRNGEEEIVRSSSALITRLSNRQHSAFSEPTSSASASVVAGGASQCPVKTSSMEQYLPSDTVSDSLRLLEHHYDMVGRLGKDTTIQTFSKSVSENIKEAASCSVASASSSASSSSERQRTSRGNLFDQGVLIQRDEVHVGPMKKMMQTAFPSMIWMKDYVKGSYRKKWKGDLSAGLTVGALLVPQSMAYALLAGLPPVQGLYASFLPLFAYAFLGTSPHLAVGPVAIVSLLTAASVQELDPASDAEYASYAATLAVLAGLFQIVFGLARLGVVVTNVLSHPVVSGFVSAAALVIASSQLKYLFGLKFKSSENFFAVLADTVGHMGGINWAAVIMSVICLLILFAIKKSKKRIPGPLIVVVLGITITYAAELHVKFNLPVVGTIPSGLSYPTFPVVENVGHLGELIVSAVSISFVGYIESISIATSLAAKNQITIRSNQELIALGVSDVVAGLFQAFPVTGGFSRTAVNVNAGAQSQFASILTSIIIMLTCLLLTPLFYYLPYAVLGSIVVMAVIPLVDYTEAIFCFKTSRIDFAILTVAFCATLAISVEVGIMSALACSVVLVIHKSSKPLVRVLGRVPYTTEFTDVDHSEISKVDLVMSPSVLVLRVDGHVFFVNARYVCDSILVAAKQSHVRVVVLDMALVESMDSSTLAEFSECMKIAEKRKTALCFASVRPSVRHVMTRSGMYEKAWFAETVFDAVRAAEEDPESRKHLPEDPQATVHIKIDEDKSFDLQQEDDVQVTRSNGQFTSTDALNNDDNAVRYGSVHDTSGLLDDDLNSSDSDVR